MTEREEGTGIEGLWKPMKHSVSVRGNPAAIRRLQVCSAVATSARLIFLNGTNSVSRVAQSVWWLATGWAAGVRSPTGAEDFSSSLRPDRFWGPPSLLCSGYRGLFPRGQKRGRGVMLTTHRLLVPRSGKSRSCTSSHPKCYLGA
jgi:hypothetical protein